MTRAESDLADDVLALGYPLSFVPSDSVSVTRGVISAKKTIEGLEMVQTDANLNLILAKAGDVLAETIDVFGPMQGNRSIKGTVFNGQLTFTATFDESSLTITFRGVVTPKGAPSGTYTVEQSQEQGGWVVTLR